MVVVVLTSDVRRVVKLWGTVEKSLGALSSLFQSFTVFRMNDCEKK